MKEKQTLNKLNIYITIFAVLSFLTLVFIFSNSFLSQEESAAESGWVSSFIKSIVDPSGFIDNEVFHAVIRKIAHFTEYFVFSVFFGITLTLLCVKSERLRIAFISLVSIAIALIDEFVVQSYSGRGPSFTDVLIDSLGSFIGYAVVALVAFLCIRRIKNAAKT